MAMSGGTGGTEFARPQRGTTERTPMADINVTPFVDVLLVLLIIFMVAAPLLVSGIELELPEAGQEALSPEKDPLTISVTKDAVFVQDAAVAWDELPKHFARLAENDAEQRVYIRGGKAIDYGRVMEVVGTLQDAGLNRIGLVSLPKPPGSAAPAAAAPAGTATP